MRWHVDLTDGDNALATRHVETFELAVSAADDLLAGARDGKGIPGEVVTEVHGRIAGEDVNSAVAGEEFSYALGDGGLVLRLAAMPEGERDEDCVVCGRLGASGRESEGPPIR